MSKKSILTIALITVCASWAPLLPWNEILTALAPWTALITIIATAVSPLIAVQVTRLLDEQRRDYEEKMRIFRTLMEFRSARMLSIEYARALSLIDAVFFGNSSQEKLIRDAFGKHIDHLANPNDSESQANSLNELIYLISESLGVNVSKQSISKNGVYPAWVGNQVQANIENTKSQSELNGFYKTAFTQLLNPAQTTKNESSANEQ